MKLALPKSRLLIFVIAALALASFVFLYIFLWRTPDSSYSAANDHLAKLRSTSTAISKVASAIQYSSDVDESTVTELAEAATQYNTTLKSLSENGAVRKDSSVRGFYNEHEGPLHEYGQAVTSLAESMDKYRTILITCSALVERLDTLTTVSAFDTASSECTTAIKAAETTIRSLFTVAFLDEYTVLAADFLNAYRDQVAATTTSAKAAATNQITRIKQEIATHGEIKLNLELKPPSDIFKDFEGVIATQSKAILR